VWRAKIACAGQTPNARISLHWIAPSFIRTIPSASDLHRTPALRLTGFPARLDYRRSGIGVAPSPCPEGSSIQLWVHYGKCDAVGQIAGIGIFGQPLVGALAHSDFCGIALFWALVIVSARNRVFLLIRSPSCWVDKKLGFFVARSMTDALFWLPGFYQFKYQVLKFYHCLV